MSQDRTHQLAQLQQAYENGHLDEDTYQAAVTALKTQQPNGSDDTGEVARDPSAQVEASNRGAAVGGDVQNSEITTGDQNIRASGHAIRAESGATVLHHVISRNRSLQLQGIRSGGKLVHIELDQIYIRLRRLRYKRGHT